MLRELRTAGVPRLVLWPNDDRHASRAIRSVALLAGSFDPVTVAHLAMAEASLARADLAVLVYSARTLPKGAGVSPPLLAERDRVETLSAACTSRRGLVAGLCSHGLLTDQMAAAAERFPGARAFVVMGSDKLAQVVDPAWYADREAALRALFASAEVLAATRHGEEGLVAGAMAEAEALGWASRIHDLDIPPAVASVASRDVRDRARRGEDVSELVPPEALPAVLAAVRRERATRDGPTTTATGRR